MRQRWQRGGLLRLGLDPALRVARCQAGLAQQRPRARATSTACLGCRSQTQ